MVKDATNWCKFYLMNAYFLCFPVKLSLEMTGNVFAVSVGHTGDISYVLCPDIIPGHAEPAA